jgi:hypothetical protein
VRRSLSSLVGAALLFGGCTNASGDDESESGTTLPDSDALGCAAPTSCNKGELFGSSRITTEDDIEAIAGHTSITGWLEVYETGAQCLEFLACMEEVGRDVTVFGNAELESLAGLDEVRRIGTSGDGNLIVSDNDALTDLDGLAGLRAVPGSLTITRHENLQSVSGLQSLELIGFDVTIQQNPVLTELSGLHDLQAVEGRFIVTQNPELCISEIEQVGADLAVGPNGGSTASNKGGC